MKPTGEWRLLYILWDGLPSWKSVAWALLSAGGQKAKVLMLLPI